MLIGFHRDSFTSVVHQGENIIAESLKSFYTTANILPGETVIDNQQYCQSWSINKISTLFSDTKYIFQIANTKWSPWGRKLSILKYLVSMRRRVGAHNPPWLLRSINSPSACEEYRAEYYRLNKSNAKAKMLCSYIVSHSPSRKLSLLLILGPSFKSCIW